MKKTLFLSTILLFVLSGCSIKDSDSCGMTSSKLIFSLHLKEDSFENQKLLSKIKNINEDFNIQNNQTNIIRTTFFDASMFNQSYQQIINEELRNINDNEFNNNRKITNKIEISKNECPTKKLYLDGIDTTVIHNIETIINLQD